MDISIVIPARYASSRFPGKPLADLRGKPMIQWVYERSSQSRLASRVLVATDDQRIADAVNAFGGQVVMTRADHPTGTDRLAEVAATLTSDLIVNVQGDEPLINPEMIDEAIAPLAADPGLVMGTLRTPLASAEEFLNPNIVKVVCDCNDMALYFSRAPIPWPRDHYSQLPSGWEHCPAWKHVGLYVYRRSFLLDIPSLPQTPLEKLESLEQLRILEHGFSIKVSATEHVAVGVDTPGDLDEVSQMLARNEDGVEAFHLSL